MREFTGNAAERADEAPAAQVNEAAAPQGFPVFTLSISLLLTLFFCVSVATYSWAVFTGLQKATFDLVELETLRGNISHRNETLELSARMAAATGDMAWVRRYRQLLPQLEQALVEARQRANSDRVAQAVDATRNASQLRRELDARAFDLLEKNQRTEAFALLTSDSYREAQRTYQEVETGLLSAIRRDLDRRNALTTRQLSLALLAGVVLPVILVLMWWLANRRVHAWRRAVNSEAQRREDAEAQLQLLNRELGRRVEARANQLRESEQRIRTIISSSPICLFALDRDGRFTLSEGNSDASRNFATHDVIGRNLMESHAEYPELCTDVARALRGEYMHGVYALGTSVFEIRLTPIFDAEDMLDSVIGVANNVSNEQAAEQRARLLATAVEQNPAGVAIMTTEGRISYVNNRLMELLDKQREELIEQDWRALRTQPVSNHQATRLQEILADDADWRSEFRVPMRDGKSRWLRARLSRMADVDGRVTHYLYSVEDISDSKQYQQTLDHQRHYDPLTNLPNRLLADKRISALLERESHEQPQTVAVLLLDLDNFKKINELSDHRVGDQLLVAAAHRIGSCARSSETVARTGGDEFLIVLNRFQGLEYVEQVADRILRSLQEPFELNGREYFLSASIGVALAPTDGETARELKKKAETAMYQAKSAGRNTYRYFHPEMNVGAQRRMLIDAQLHHALERQEMSLHYQPIVELSSGQVVAAEALLRWNNEALGPIGPDEFIPVAEAGSVIHSIGAWVLKRACEQAVAWRELFTNDAPLRIAVNVSSRQFGEPDFADKALRILKQTGALPQQISLEVTESLLIENPPVVAENLSRLAAHGIDISVDDFGTGYSSLGYLKHFSFSTLKIDRLFVRDVIEDRNDAELAAGIIALGHGLKMKVTGEGVETPAQLRFLHSKGCDQAQGYLFGKPMPADEFERWAESQQLRMNEFLSGSVSSGPSSA